MRRFPELGHNSAPEAGIVISPYAKQGYIDHQTLSFDAYTKFIEDDFLAGQRLDPADRRATLLGISDFDFN